MFHNEKKLSNKVKVTNVITETRLYIEKTRESMRLYFDQANKNMDDYFTSSPPTKDISIIESELREFNEQFTTGLKEKVKSLARVQSSLVNENANQEITPIVLENNLGMINSLAHWSDFLLTEFCSEVTELQRAFVSKVYEVNRKNDIKNDKIEFLNQLNTFLTKVQKDFPVIADDLSLKAKMGMLVHRLSSDVERYSSTIRLGDPLDENAVKAYNEFKKSIDLHLNQDDDTQDLKKPDSIYHSFYCMLILLLRAFFRVFDIMITFVTQAEHTMAETPNRNAFFKLPEKKVDKLVLALSNRFTAAIQELNDLNTTETASFTPV